MDPIVPLERPSAPRRGPVVVFAPHPDDEVIGCGGTLALHADQGDAVHVVVVFDGGTGDPTGAWDRTTLARRRRDEAIAGGRALTGTDLGFSYEFWDLSEGHVPTAAELDAAARRMALCLDEKDPATVYAPWYGDGHRDHRSVGRALELALERTPQWTGEAWGFEVWTPLAPERVLDIGRTIERKKLALACHATQSPSGELAHRALGLGAYRSQLLGPGARFAEVFSRVPLVRSEESAA